MTRKKKKKDLWAGSLEQTPMSLVIQGKQLYEFIHDNEG